MVCSSNIAEASVGGGRERGGEWEEVRAEWRQVIQGLVGRVRTWASTPSEVGAMKRSGQSRNMA